ncbi:MAG TPA: ABC transporter permease [Streptosporangiaceae bacterium]
MRHINPIIQVMLPHITDTSTGWVENSHASRTGLRPLLEVLHHRDLVRFLALRDLKVRYKQAVFGVAWVVLQPLLGVAVFTIVFNRIAGVAAPGVPYVVFAYVGLAGWGYLSGSVNECAESLVRYSALVTKVYFPRVIAPLASVLPGLADLAVASVALAVLMAVTRTAPGLALFALPFAVLSLVITALAVGIWLSALNVQFRDVRLVLAFFLQLWLFVSPVVYPPDLVHGSWRFVYALNPSVGSLGLLRWSLLGMPLDVAPTAESLLLAVALLAGGLHYFQATERRFADVI